MSYCNRGKPRGVGSHRQDPDCDDVGPCRAIDYSDRLPLPAETAGAVDQSSKPAHQA